ncbi:MAG TPA: 2-dehydro-3-deoxygalactonokinase [Caulobacteraceae bacterium]|nr:2-dehydro-3-deoxygalactonokinase [Caulobacteraceae bacterium]
MDGAFLACDWGTTNLRAWVVGVDGQAREGRDFPLGVSRLQPGEAARRFREEVRPALSAETLPTLMCGMVGSTLGWTVAPYRDCPAGFQELAASLLTVEDGPAPVRIVPGLRGPGVTAAPDVMRGEETQVLGWLAQDPARERGRHVVCHPGTHAKWVLVEDGRIVRFVTAMTGELFSTLSRHGVLATTSPPGDEAAFREGVAAAGDGGGLSARLFSARSRVVGGEADPAGAASYLSGLLIGAEVASLPGLLGTPVDEPVVLLGDPVLCRWYGVALAERGLPCVPYSGDEAALAGLAAIQSRVAP